MGKKIAYQSSQFIMPIMLFSTLAQIDPHLTSNYLVLGYAVMWLIGFIYVMTLWLQQRNMQRDIDLMKQILADTESEKNND